MAEAPAAPTDNQLVARTLDGDVGAFNDLVVRWETSLYRFVVRYLGDSEEARDICQEAFLKASNVDQFDQFGISVAVSGETLVVGASGEDSSAVGVDGNQADNSLGQAGAAYVFVRSGATWSQETYLKASNTGFDGLATAWRLQTTSSWSVPRAREATRQALTETS